MMSNCWTTRLIYIFTPKQIWSDEVTYFCSFCNTCHCNAWVSIRVEKIKHQLTSPEADPSMTWTSPPRWSSFPGPTMEVLSALMHCRGYSLSEFWTLPPKPLKDHVVSTFGQHQLCILAHLPQHHTGMSHLGWYLDWNRDKIKSHICWDVNHHH